MSTRLNDIANELNNRAQELAQTPDLEQVARALHNAAGVIRLVDRGGAPLTGVHRVAFILLGNRDATQRFVRKMLDGAGLSEVEFTLIPATAAELEARYRQIDAAAAPNGSPR